jgi:hypothetical protein
MSMQILEYEKAPFVQGHPPLRFYVLSPNRVDLQSGSRVHATIPTAVHLLARCSPQLGRTEDYGRGRLERNLPWKSWLPLPH